MSPRRDLLRECNDRQAPLDEFQAGFCGRCINPECTRSLFGQSKFDVRVNTWEERLFTDVPKMDTHDERFAAIAGKRFLTFDTGRTPEIRTDWVDPRDVPQEPVIIKEATPSTPEPSPEPSPVVKPVPHAPSRVPVHLLRANTAVSSGVMVGEAPPSAPPRDPWATPEPSKDLIVPVGSRVKMGGTGV